MTALHKGSKYLLYLTLTFSVTSQTTPQARSQAPDAQVRVTARSDSAPPLSDRAKKQLQDKLESGATSALHVVAVDGAPLEISDPKVTSIKIEGNYDAPPDAAPPINDYAMKLSFTLVNRTNQVVTGAGLEFTNTRENNTFFVYHSKLEIEPGKSKKFDTAFMTVSGDPAYLLVELAGAQFLSGDIWEGFPFPKRRRKASDTQSSPATRPGLRPPVLPVPPSALPANDAVSQVDAKPKLLNNPSPRYTEQARTNSVMGTVVTRVLIESDGSVKRVNVRNALPDGLTEQAIRAAYELKFQPARKNGEPVAYWQTVEIEFNLK
jgi:protein TonB